MTYIIVGGSAGLGRAIAKKFASEKNDLIIISSDLRDTKALASDLEIRYGVNVIPLQLSLSKDQIRFKEVDGALENLSPIEGLILPVGFNHPNDIPGLDDKSFSELVNTNFTSVCLYINHFLPILKKITGHYNYWFWKYSSYSWKIIKCSLRCVKTCIRKLF